MSSILSLVSLRLCAANATRLADRRWLAAAGAIGFGALLLFVAGFAGADALHNAAHDGRHAFAFPCH